MVVGWRVNYPRPLKQNCRILESLEILVVTNNVCWESSSYMGVKNKVK
jgi:hypothetical protein